jgi:hypothetical protein
MLLGSAAGLDAAPPVQPRCKPDWTREGRTGSAYGCHGDPHYRLKQAGVRADPEELLGVVVYEKDHRIRIDALFAISDCEFRETRGELEKFLEDPASKEFREILTKILLRWGSEKARAHVRDAATNPLNDDKLRLKWYPEHLEHGGSCDLPFLRSMVISKSPMTRSVCAPAVAGLLDRPECAEEGLELLRTLLRDSQAEVRSRALHYLYVAADRGKRSDLWRLIEEVAAQGAGEELRLEASKYLGKFELLEARSEPKK